MASSKAEKLSLDPTLRIRPRTTRQLDGFDERRKAPATYAARRFQNRRMNGLPGLLLPEFSLLALIQG